MINDFKYIKDKTLELESQIDTLSKSTLKNYKSFKSINKKLLNYSILKSSTIELSKLTLIAESNICFYTQVSFYLPSAQSVEFSLMVDDICIFKSVQNFETGSNQTTLLKEYNPLITSESTILLKIKSLTEKQIEVNNVNLLIYGLSEVSKDVFYKSLIANDKLVLSFLEDNEIYYLVTDKSLQAYNSEEFYYYSSATSYDMSYDDKNDKILFFRVDTNKNLLYSTFDHNIEKLIDDNVDFVSSSYGNNQTLVCYVKNMQCYYVTIYNDTVSKTSKLNNYSTIKKVKTIFNEHSNKFYVVMSDDNNENYLVESADDKISLSENISASFNFLIETYGGTSEIQNT